MSLLLDDSNTEGIRYTGVSVPTTYPCTMLVWFKPDAVGINVMPIALGEQSVATDWAGIDITASNEPRGLHLTYGSGTAVFAKWATGPVVADKWQCALAEFEESGGTVTVTIYYNGEWTSVVSSSQTCGSWGSNDEVWLGADFGVGSLGRYFSGRIGHAAVWSRLLSKTEKYYLFNRVRPDEFSTSLTFYAPLTADKLDTIDGGQTLVESGAPSIDSTDNPPLFASPYALTGTIRSHDFTGSTPLADSGDDKVDAVNNGGVTFSAAGASFGAGADNTNVLLIPPFAPGYDSSPDTHWGNFVHFAQHSLTLYFDQVTTDVTTWQYLLTYANAGATSTRMTIRINGTSASPFSMSDSEGDLLILFRTEDGQESWWSSSGASAFSASTAFDLRVELQLYDGTVAAYVDDVEVSLTAYGDYQGEFNLIGPLVDVCLGGYNSNGTIATTNLFDGTIEGFRAVRPESWSSSVFTDQPILYEVVDGDAPTDEDPTYRSPNLIEADNGNLICILEKRPSRADTSEMGQSAFYSTDSGVTWTEVVIEAYKQTSKRFMFSPCWKKANGDIVAYYIEWDTTSATNTIQSVVWSATSTTNGTTWGTPVDITSKFPGTWYGFAFNSGQGYTYVGGDYDGRWLDVVQYAATTGTAKRTAVIWSDDEGDTWSYVDVDTAGENQIESAIFQVPNGDLVLITRNADGSVLYQRRWAVSSDGGETWNSLANDARLFEPEIQADMGYYSGSNIIGCWPATKGATTSGTTEFGQKARRNGCFWVCTYGAASDARIDTIDYLHPVVPGPCGYSVTAPLSGGGFMAAFEIGINDDIASIDRIVFGLFSGPANTIIPTTGGAPGGMVPILGLSTRFGTRESTRISTRFS